MVLANSTQLYKKHQDKVSKKLENNGTFRDPPFANPYFNTRPRSPEYGALEARQHENQPLEDQFPAWKQALLSEFVEKELLERSHRRNIRHKPVDHVFYQSVMREVFCEFIKSEYERVSNPYLKSLSDT